MTPTRCDYTQGETNYIISVGVEDAMPESFFNVVRHISTGNKNIDLLFFYLFFVVFFST